MDFEHFSTKSKEPAIVNGASIQNLIKYRLRLASEIKHYGLPFHLEAERVDEYLKKYLSKQQAV